MKASLTPRQAPNKKLPSQIKEDISSISSSSSSYNIYNSNSGAIDSTILDRLPLPLCTHHSLQPTRRAVSPTGLGRRKPILIPSPTRMDGDAREERKINMPVEKGLKVQIPSLKKIKFNR